MPRRFTFALQAQPVSPGEWCALALRAEDLGFEAICIGDHPGLTASPFVALAVAAQATTRIKLATAVLNVGVREPMHIAADAATLAYLSTGRAILGLGAGHTPAEWTAIGLHYPSPSERAGRLIEAMDVIERLLVGEEVTHQGRYLRLEAAKLTSSAASHVPLLVGTNNTSVLKAAAARVDIVELTGLGPTLNDGHHHETRWSDSAIETRVAIIGEASVHRSKPLVLGALVQHVELTEQPLAAAERFIAATPAIVPRSTLPSPQDVLAAPFALIGTVEGIVEKLLATRKRWGLTRYTVRVDSMDDVAAVIARLAELGELDTADA